MSVPRVIVFDWGGVIVRICRSFEEGCAAAGVGYDGAVMEGELYGVRRAASLRYQVGEIDAATFFEASSGATGGRYSAGQIALIHDAWILGEYAGVGELVDELHATPGVETALLSNTNERHWARRAASAYGPAFPTAGRLMHQQASHVLGFAKPDAAIYRAFERATGARPSEIVFFDDLPENCEAARACGWRAERVDHTGDTAGQMRAALMRLGVLGEPGVRKGRRGG